MIGFPAFLVIVLIVVLVLILSASNRVSDDKRERRLCGDCGATHPPFAQFCRRCGKKL